MATKNEAVKKTTARKAKTATSKKAAKTAKVTHREGTIRAALEVLYRKHGYADGKKEAIKKGYNKFTVHKQMYLIHSGQ